MLQNVRRKIKHNLINKRFMQQVSTLLNSLLRITRVQSTHTEQTGKFYIFKKLSEPIERNY